MLKKKKKKILKNFKQKLTLEKQGKFKNQIRSQQNQQNQNRKKTAKTVKGIRK